MSTVLITGASAGIGKELAYVYAENGHDLILVARRKERLEEVKQNIEQKYPVKVNIIAQDLALPESAEELYRKLENEHVEILINNAGFGAFGDFIEYDIKQDEGIIMLNMLTLTKLTKLFGKQMQKKGGGNIINIASTGAFQPVPNLAVYAATKAYVLNFSEAIAFELKKYKVFVTAICPGPTKSEFASVAAMSENPFKNAPSSRELAEFVYRAMTKKKVCAIHGVKNSLLAFSIRILPRKLVAFIASKIME